MRRNAGQTAGRKPRRSDPAEQVRADEARPELRLFKVIEHGKHRPVAAQQLVDGAIDLAGLDPIPAQQRGGVVVREAA